MPAKVFISCGQAAGVERVTAQAVKLWFESQGYVAYVATEVQTLTELNQNIMEELKTSDYYIFINFAREHLVRPDNAIRGSVYTQQELAVAYALHFDDMLVLNQTGTTKEGVHYFIISNTAEFVSHSDVLSTVRNAVAGNNWNPNHSRKLNAVGVTLSNGPILYGDHAGPKYVWIASVEIRNGRPDISAVHCSARCISVLPGTASINRGYLKVNGHLGYNQLIWPSENARFDILNIHADNYPNGQLNIPFVPAQFLLPYPQTTVPTDMDYMPRPVLLSSMGTYVISYEVYADKFPRLTFDVRLDVTGAVPTVALV